METLEVFYERYRAGMESMRDLKELDEFFGLPWMVTTPDGQSFCQHNYEDLRAFTRTRFDSFAADKLTKWTRRSFDAVTLGTNTTLVSINWEVARDDGSPRRAWRHYYMTAKTPRAGRSSWLRSSLVASRAPGGQLIRSDMARDVGEYGGG